MLIEKDKKLGEKEAYIVHLQTALAGDQPVTPAPQQQQVTQVSVITFKFYSGGVRSGFYASLSRVSAGSEKVLDLSIC